MFSLVRSSYTNRRLRGTLDLFDTLERDLSSADTRLAEVLPALAGTVLPALTTLSSAKQLMLRQLCEELVNRRGPTAEEMRRIARAGDVLKTALLKKPYVGKTKAAEAVIDAGSPARFIPEGFTYRDDYRSGDVAYLDFSHLFAPYVDLLGGDGKGRRWVNLPPDQLNDLGYEEDYQAFFDSSEPPARHRRLASGKHVQVAWLVFQDTPETRREAIFRIYPSGVKLERVIITDGLEGVTYMLDQEDLAGIHGIWSTRHYMVRFLSEKEIAAALKELMTAHGWDEETYNRALWGTGEWTLAWNHMLTDEPAQAWHTEATVHKLAPATNRHDGSYREWRDGNMNLCWVYTYHNWELRGVGHNLPVVTYQDALTEHTAQVGEASWPRLFAYVKAARVQFFRAMARQASFLNEDNFAKLFPPGYLPATIREIHLAQIALAGKAP